MINLVKNDVEIILDQSSFSQTGIMGSLPDPLSREKYSEDELIKLVKKYETIQMNIKQIQDDMRMTTFEMAAEQ